MRAFVTYNELGRNGRLGNCLFQIATTIAYALDNNMDYWFPQWEGSRYLNTPLQRGDSQGARDIRERSFSYYPLPHSDVPVNLMGYFQSWRYFDHHRNAILDAFAPTREIYEHVGLTIAHQFKRWDRTCSIHVRRGDYANNPATSAYHGVLPVKYYTDAIGTLYGDDISSVCFNFFSDDIDWCKKEFWMLGPNAIFHEGNLPIVDLFLMAACRDNIIANSSFSWWGSYLNKHKKKSIVAPKNWFAGENAPKDTHDIYLPETIIL